MNQITFCYFEQEEQRKIAEILTTVEDAIEQTEALIKKYQRIKQGLMQDLLTRGVDENGNIRNIESSTFIESRYGRIPRSWQICTLVKITEKIADRDRRTPQYVDEGIFIVSPKDFNELDNINFETYNHIPISEHLVNKKKTDLRPNDIVFTRIGTGLGKACLVTEDMPEFSILHSMAQIRPNNNIVQPEYLLHSLRSFYLQKQIKDGIQSIGVPDLGLEKIRQLEILLPTINDQERISTVLANNDYIVKVLYSELKKIYKLKQGLMQDLLTGKVRVTGILES